jgi:membrane dipeptidase
MQLGLVQLYPKVFELIRGPKDIKRVYAEGIFTCSMGIEGYINIASNSA